MARRAEPRTLLVTLAFAPVCGCATAPQLCFGQPGLQSVSLYSTPATNGGAPVAVDLVYVTQKALAQTIAKLSASDYYGSNARRQLLNDYPGAVYVWFEELPAGDSQPKAAANGSGGQPQVWFEQVPGGGFAAETQLKPPCNPVKTFLFASYASDGPHRVEVGKTRAIIVDLGPDDLTIRR